MSNTVYDVVVIGAGASGLMLAANLDMGYSSGVVLEGTSCIGKKLLMSGGGHCNITHGGSIKDFVSAYGDAGPAIRKCLYKHNNLELIAFLEGIGIETTEEDGRVFPASMKAKDVLDALVSEAASNMWQIETDAKVRGLEKSTDGDWIIEIKDRGEIRAHNIVIATGGITYPETGSNGFMFELLKGLGLSINEPRPALTPIYVEYYPYAELAGISIPDASVSVTGKEAGDKTVRMSGDILFTHEGFSGPAILNISKHAREGAALSISYDKPLEDLPKRMQRILQDRARGESGDIKTKMLEGLLDKDEFTVKGVSERGMVSSGGVMLDEVDMGSMRCKSDGSLYVIGEALDADGITGGYNLQMCWSTACSCADALRDILTNSYSGSRIYE